jgi:hypothetical protein
VGGERIGLLLPGAVPWAASAVLDASSKVVGMMGRGMYRIMFALMDTDGDGTLSLEEFQAAHAKIFKAMDANKDGKLTLEEIEMFMRGGSPASNQ